MANIFSIALSMVSLLLPPSVLWLPTNSILKMDLRGLCEGLFLTNVETGEVSVQRVFLGPYGSDAVLKLSGFFYLLFVMFQKFPPYNVLMGNCNRLGVLFCGFSGFRSFLVHAS